MLPWPRREGEASALDAIAEGWFSHAARALAHCRCGQAQRSFGPSPSAASEQAWLQYFSPASTGQVHCGLAQRSSITASVMKASLGQGVEVFSMRGNGVRRVWICDIHVALSAPCSTYLSFGISGTHSRALELMRSQARLPNATVSRPLFRGQVPASTKYQAPPNKVP